MNIGKRIRSSASGRAIFLLFSPALFAAPSAEGGECWIEDAATKIHAAWNSNDPMPRLSELHPGATLADAYRVQAAFVEKAFGLDGIGGFKSAAVTQKMDDAPFTGLMPEDGIFPSLPRVIVDLSNDPRRMVETEIGFRFKRSISEPIRDIETLKEHVSEILAVVEIPGGTLAPGPPPSWSDLVAININARDMIVGDLVLRDHINPDLVAIQLFHNDEMVGEASGGDAVGGQWNTLLNAVNQVVASGHRIEPGQIFTNGAVGKILKAEPGVYRAEFAGLGTIEFEVRE